jgi:hypothetical protein
MLFSFVIQSWCVGLALLFNDGHKADCPERRFFQYVNSYQRDSLNALLTDDFILSRGYTSISSDREDFLDNYLHNSKLYRGQFKIIKVLHKSQPMEFLVKDKTEYLECLNVRYPQWKFTIYTHDNKIQRAHIDTCVGYSEYVTHIQKREQDFEAWLNKAHSGETINVIREKDNLLISRAKEFASAENGLK